MSGFQRVAILCLVIFTGLLVACTEPDSKASRERAEPLVTGLPDFTRLVEKEGPAVVNISTITRQSEESVRDQLDQLPELFRRFVERFGGEEGVPSMPQEREARSLGSGFIISADGYVLTNNHVVAEADEIIVRLQDRRELKAELIGADEQSDLALLKLDGEDLLVVNIGSSDDLKVGEWVLAIGAPFGFDSSVTAGIVSAKGRSLPIAGSLRWREDLGRVVKHDGNKWRGKEVAEATWSQSCDSLDFLKANDHSMALQWALDMEAGKEDTVRVPGEVVSDWDGEPIRWRPFATFKAGMRGGWIPAPRSEGGRGEDHGRSASRKAGHGTRSERALPVEVQIGRPGELRLHPVTVTLQSPAQPRVCA